MAKRKQSAFERLQRGERLSRKERREVQQRLNLGDPGLDFIHRDAAGIDVGKEPFRVGTFRPRPIMHAPDQTVLRPRPLHCCINLAAPSQRRLCLRSDPFS